MRYWAPGYFLEQPPPDGAYWPKRYWSQGEYSLSIASTLDDFPAAFAGALGAVDRTGSIAVTLADATTAFAGTHSSLGSYWHEFQWAPHYWSTNYWQNREPSESTGTIAVTLDAFATDFDGTSALVGNNRSGTVATTLGGFTSAFAATFSPPVNLTGTIAVTLTDFMGSMLGGSVQIEYMDISVPIGIAWVATEFPAFTGSISITLANAAALMSGTFLPAQAVSGFINGQIAAHTAVFQGTHIAPAGNVGVIVCSTADATSTITGIALQPGGFQGTIVTTLGDCPTVFSATHIAPIFTGSMGAGLDDFATVIQALFVEAGAKIGPLNATLEDTTASMHGNVTGNVISRPKRLIRTGHRRIIRVRRRA